MSRSVLGIIGGMGPAATADLFTKIVAETPAERDQDHIRVLIDSHAQIPDRTEAVLKNGSSPAPGMAESARLLSLAGADVLLIACNTAHAWFDAVQSAVDIPVISMIEVTVAAVEDKGAARVGVLATTACLEARLYQDRLEARGISPVLLDEEEQADFMTTIGRIKATGPDESTAARIALDIKRLEERGAEVVVAGCTEVPLVLETGSSDRVVSSTDELARAAVRRALGSAPVDGGP